MFLEYRLLLQLLVAPLLETVAEAIKATDQKRQHATDSPPWVWKSLPFPPRSVSRLRTSLSRLWTSVPRLLTSIARLQTSIARLRTSIARLRTSIARLRTSIARLQTSIARLRTSIELLLTSIELLLTPMNPSKSSRKGLPHPETGVTIHPYHLYNPLNCNMLERIQVV